MKCQAVLLMHDLTHLDDESGQITPAVPVTTGDKDRLVTAWPERT